MLRPLRPGDHIRVRRKLYAHDGIVVGDGQVVHFTGIARDKASGRIQLDSLAEFLAGADRVEVIEYARGSCHAPDDVVRLAWSRVGEGEYHLLIWNCQHFARWCKTGHENSDQVERVVTVAVGASIARLASSAMVGAVAVAAIEGTWGGAATMSGLAALGGSATGGLLAVAAAPAAAATVAAHRLLRDDECLPQAERTARRAGRQASTAGALGGVGLSLAVVSGAGVPGLSAVGITTGLAALGGTMLGGLLLVGLVPAATAMLAGIAIHRLRRPPPDIRMAG